MLGKRPGVKEGPNEGVAQRVGNVPATSPTTDAKSLPDVIAHYQTAKLNSVKMVVRRDGTVPTETILEPGAWAHERPGSKANFGDGNGIAPVCRQLTKDIAALTEDVLGILRDQSEHHVSSKPDA